MHIGVTIGEVHREKRFVLQRGTTRFAFPIPTTYPIPTLPLYTGITPPTVSTRTWPTNKPGIFFTPPTQSIINATQINCPAKRDASRQRVLLDDNLLKQVYLELIGNYDQRVTAATAEEAAKNFQHLLKSRGNEISGQKLKAEMSKDIQAVKNWQQAVQSNMANTTGKLNSTQHSRTGKKLQTSIKRILKQIHVTKRDLRYILGLSNSLDEILQYKTLQMRSSRAKRDTNGAVSHIEYCQARGHPTGDGYLHMCTSCALTTQLPEDRFPRYINEVDCHLTDCDCFNTPNTAHGRCQKIVRTIKMLKRKAGGCRLLIQNGQQFILDDWQVYDQRIRVGCECVFNKNSQFAGFIPLTG
ncbi:uncharacterized protein LOC128210610 [Mya arenaria]|uniref:uncharacterized protein LOC128210610 n=1 Tax=Mya arenaria TaxID=6604 RepID=UPI0022E8B1B3|nr:uncharacterized protein LOC128210610 [Mya arenaria]